VEILALSETLAAPTMPVEAHYALVELLRRLRAAQYAFVTPTPATHARVLRHPGRRQARSMRDVFGWSLPFHPDILPPDLLDLMRRGDILREDPRGLASTVRVSSLYDLLLMHSAYPTEAEDSVFFGPDSYRFADFVRAELPQAGEVRRLVDIGAGAGAGALAAGLLLPATELVLTDVNPKALGLARINAEAAGRRIVTVETAHVGEAPKPFELAIANPPYIVDSGGREYRDGGGLHGGQVSLDMARAALEHLAPGGRLLLYTGAAIVDGRDELKVELVRLAQRKGAQLSYRELDPDVFGEELTQPQYADVERIAVIGAVLVKPA
jgi:hypothetical protein